MAFIPLGGRIKRAKTNAKLIVNALNAYKGGK
jgi:hypothetical protein